MSAIAFLVHSLDGRNTLWYLQSFEPCIVENAKEETDTETGLKKNLNKVFAQRIVQKVVEDFEIRSDQLELGYSTFLEGSFLIHDEKIYPRSVFVVYQRVQNFCFTLATSIECNKVLASYLVGQLVLQLVKESPKDPKDFLQKPEETTAIVEQLIPHGKMVFAGNPGSISKLMTIYNMTT